MSFSPLRSANTSLLSTWQKLLVSARTKVSATKILWPTCAMITWKMIKTNRNQLRNCFKLTHSGTCNVVQPIRAIEYTSAI